MPTLLRKPLVFSEIVFTPSVGVVVVYGRPLHVFSSP